ncbi:hypothetical protein GRFL_1062 [Christiangramia flava JLT2011]|uniref:Uncharacterized protein n=1 Tax=Christiangramia flava JLT2011 TaxID=1229726 RepID=A0A1L7I2F8_9FLAO|nr:hypothetical protein GRFL_1062 [Christiangramia flava JLT2011]
MLKFLQKYEQSCPQNHPNSGILNFGKASSEIGSFQQAILAIPQ